jgi:hypothetical protein
MGLTSTKDWSLLRLPDVLFPLYFVLRPFLWFWRWFLKGHRAEGIGQRAWGEE